MELPLLPTGEQHFEKIRKNGMLYVDKTHYIFQLLQTLATFWFLPRPRRFGKSLLISTLKAIFQGRKDLFEGLYIYDKIDWEPHPVIHLDFSNMDFRGKGLNKAINDALDAIAAEYGVVFKETTIGSKFSELMSTLHAQTGKQVAILIDEYDKPITDVLEAHNKEKAFEHRDILRTLYSVVKGSSGHIRFFFLTGIARFSKVSLFSDLNNLTDLTTRSEYHNMLGYTQQELETYFSAHLNYICREQNIPMEKLLADIKEWYNGFSWNGHDKLYNPFSILNFMEARAFHNFWVESGTPKFLIELLEKEMVYDLSGKKVIASQVNNFDIGNLGLETLFFQTGYLTIKAIDSYGRYLLDYPNREVSISMLEHIIGMYANKQTAPALAIDLIDAVKTNDMEWLVRIINTLFASIPYQIFDQHQEKFFHALLFSALRLCGFHIQAEVSVATGRVDAVLQYENRVYVFEFKLNAPAEDALNQIREKGYHQPYLGQGKEVYLVGISFSGAKKAVEGIKAAQG